MYTKYRQKMIRRRDQMLRNVCRVLVAGSLWSRPSDVEGEANRLGNYAGALTSSSMGKRKGKTADDNKAEDDEEEGRLWQVNKEI
jgi:hypothetical protein